MENNYETLRMPELKALVRECGLRNYSRFRKAELIAFLRDNEQRRQRPPQMSTWEPNRPPQMSTWEPNRPPSRNKCIETKIAELNKKIRRAKNRRNK